MKKTALTTSVARQVGVCLRQCSQPIKERPRSTSLESPNPFSSLAQSKIPGIKMSLDKLQAPARKVSEATVRGAPSAAISGTVPVLDFLTCRASAGSVLSFDDCHCYRHNPDFGQQRAVRESLEMKPQLSLSPLLSLGWSGMVFTVTLC